MEALRRLVASLVTATLLLAGPLGVPSRCVECPPGCPMHAQIGEAFDAVAIDRPARCDADLHQLRPGGVEIPVGTHVERRAVV